MVARVTLAEVDPVRMSVDAAVRRFEDLVVPVMREQAGYAGAYGFATPEGRLMLVTFWEDAASAEAGVASGYYAEQLEKFVTFFRAPPGRELYEVVFAEAPAGVV